MQGQGGQAGYRKRLCCSRGYQAAGALSPQPLPMAPKAKSESLAGTPEWSMLPTSKDSAEVRRLKAEVKRLTEERDILEKAVAHFAKG